MELINFYFEDTKTNALVRYKLYKIYTFILFGLVNRMKFLVFHLSLSTARN